MAVLQRVALAALSLLVVASTGATAQGYPTRPITLIVPWPAGGSTDTHLRKLAELAGKNLGQPIVVENKPGAGGMLGPSGMARAAAPDGYTLSQLHVGAFRQPIMQKVDWDPLKDFTYIIGVSGYTFGMVVRTDSPFKSSRTDLVREGEPGSSLSSGTGTSRTWVEQLARRQRGAAARSFGTPIYRH
jgi:tripartite-type tricarboxylate transporter receptor subunit TctC